MVDLVSGGPKKIILGPKKISFLTVALRDFWFFTIYLLLCSDTKKPSGFWIFDWEVFINNEYKSQ
jgi:hypothetical protein